MFIDTINIKNCVKIERNKNGNKGEVIEKIVDIYYDKN